MCVPVMNFACSLHMNAAIAPKSPPAAGPLAYQGSVNIYVRPQAEQMVTVVGETPAKTVRQVAESLIPREH